MNLMRVWADVDIWSCLMTEKLITIVTAGYSLGVMFFQLLPHAKHKRFLAQAPSLQVAISFIVPWRQLWLRLSKEKIKTYWSQNQVPWWCSADCYGLCQFRLYMTSMITWWTVYLDWKSCVPFENFFFIMMWVSFEIINDMYLSKPRSSSFGDKVL